MAPYSKSHRTLQVHAILSVFEKIYSLLFIPNCTRNIEITYTNCVTVRCSWAKTLRFQFHFSFVSFRIPRVFSCSLVFVVVDQVFLVASAIGVAGSI